MKDRRIVRDILRVGIVALGIVAFFGRADGQMQGRLATFDEWEQAKSQYDDPRPFLKEAGAPKNYLPPEIYNQVTFDVDAMQNAWTDALGLKAPDVVGKRALEIKPGTYGYQDKEAYPFQDLMIAHHYTRFKPGAPPYVGNFPEVTVVPTRHYYYALPITKATQQYEGTARLSDRGYLIADSYRVGVPFPKPSGPFKAQQVLYNWVKRYANGENSTQLARSHGYTRTLSRDWAVAGRIWRIKANGRTLFEPLGWYDQRAQELSEEIFWSLVYVSPQDYAGNVVAFTFFDDVQKPTQQLLYFNQIRRLRKLSSDDTQDPFPGSDTIMDDMDGFGQKLSPSRFPYTYEVLAKREYLLPSYSWDGAMYFTSTNGIEMRHADWERRPVYVVQLTQQDPTYVYSKRILYIDQETFLLHFTENYDQKGRLYRTTENVWAFYEHQGMFGLLYHIGMDHVDVHSTLTQLWSDPFAYWVTRQHTGMGQLMRQGK